jgi:hypothetical protein
MPRGGGDVCPMSGQEKSFVRMKIKMNEEKRKKGKESVGKLIQFELCAGTKEGSRSCASWEKGRCNAGRRKQPDDVRGRSSLPSNHHSEPGCCVEGSCRLIFVSIENDEMAIGVSFAPSASLVEVHAVTSRLFVLDHLEIICR